MIYVAPSQTLGHCGKFVSCPGISEHCEPQHTSCNNNKGKKTKHKSAPKKRHKRRINWENRDRANQDDHNKKTNTNNTGCKTQPTNQSTGCDLALSINYKQLFTFK